MYIFQMTEISKVGRFTPEMFKMLFPSQNVIKHIRDVVKVTLF